MKSRPEGRGKGLDGDRRSGNVPGGRDRYSRSFLGRRIVGSRKNQPLNGHLSFSNAIESKEADMRRVSS